MAPQFLWSRVTDRKLSNPDRVKIVNIQTYTHRTCDIGDINIIFSPNTDLALWNYIAHEIVYNHPEAIDWDFIKENIVFTAGPVNIGYGMRRAGEKSIKEGKLLLPRKGRNWGRNPIKERKDWGKKRGNSFPKGRGSQGNFKGQLIGVLKEGVGLTLIWKGKQLLWGKLP